ncbi:MAG: AmmeMemoRadiSam system protein A [Spirochaetes bacterium]|nr:MAG: AmmeMemoRadiSam system protein A [Spirochaetota bacterium]
MIELNEQQQQKLLALARKAIRQYLETKTLPIPDMEEEFSDPVFCERCGAFVTLHIDGRLRGCIGYITGIKNIPDTVVDMARASAFQDPRFPPLRAQECDLAEIEISVMSPLEDVSDIGDIKVGRDGLIVSSGRQSGLLLPQVATEYNWDTAEFIEHTCTKAGMPCNAWKKPGVRIQKFSAQVFCEKRKGVR